VSLDGTPLTGYEREVVDLELEILHNRYGPPPENGRPDYAVMLHLIDLRSSDIDVNVMLEASWVMDITLSKQSDGLVKFDLLPNIGLDIRLTCCEIVVSSVEAYRRENL
jgi:hypothetical protein